jgi:hypothetical protein
VFALTSRLIASAIAVAAVLALSACDPAEFPGPVALQLDGKRLLIAVCEPLDVETVHIDWQAQNESWQDVISGRGSAALGSGDQFASDELPIGVKVVSQSSLPLDPGASYLVSIGGRADAKTVTWESRATLEALLEAGDRWVQSDGKSTREPCASS